jgi:hypothetical protein
VTDPTPRPAEVFDAPFGTLDDLPDSTDVVARKPRAAVSIAALLLAALLAVVVVVFGFGTVAHVLEVGGDSMPDIASVEERTGIDFPDGSEVLAAASAADVFTAEVALPSDALPDFAHAGYGPVSEASDALEEAVAPEAVAQYYHAASNSLVGDAALVERGGALVLFVDVRGVR